MNSVGNRRLHKWILCTVVFLMTTRTYACRLQNSDFYEVVVFNKQIGHIDQVAVEFDRKVWAFEFGVIGSGSNKGYVADEMPTPPPEFTIRWQTTDGKKLKKTVTVSEAIRKQIVVDKVMTITVLKNDDVTVGAK